MSRTRFTRIAVVTGMVVAATALFACGGDKVVTSTSAPTPPERSVAVVDAGAAPAMKAMEYAESDFVENDRNRDPFRSFVTLFVDKATAPRPTQRQVILEQYSLDELKLVAIITGGDYPRAMMIDPTSKGWVIKRGDFVGRPDVVHTGGANGADYQLNWRVDRVREGDIVFIREDPAQPGIPPATRVIPLHPDSDQKGDQAQL